jgi:hypothetical protein
MKFGIKTRRQMVLIVLLLGLNACASIAGSEDKMSREYITQHVIIGKTTQADLRALYGEPSFKNESSFVGSFWSYDETQINPNYALDALRYLPWMGKTADTIVNDAVSSQRKKTSRSLGIYFDDAGVVTNLLISG